MLTLDHIAIAATSLDSGSRAIEDQLRLPLEAGGQHATMGTQNRLLSLGPDYLEVIAIDPAAPAPARPRWFDLDGFTGPARPNAWICRCDDLDAALSAAPAGSGRILSFARGDLRWRMAVPEDGKLPFKGLFPALMQWDCAEHPASRLTDVGARLITLELHSSQAPALRAALAPLIDDPRLVIVEAPQALIRVTLSTPGGEVIL
jgi:hypothetical protein